MPIHHNPDGTYQWGHQAKYKSRAGAERQQAAIYANGYKGDEAPDDDVDWNLLDEEFDELFEPFRSSTASDAKPFAAGVIYMAPSGKVLWVKRAKGDLVGKWAFPGGHIEPGESLVETVKRESNEEIGYAPEGKPVQFHEDQGYVTFIQPVKAEDFEVNLNEEHDDSQWAPLDMPPQPCHPCIEKMLKIKGMAKDSILAMDRSVRSYDMDGRLHVETTPISKANVCEYYGREIPNYISLGLDPDRRYKLYRDPEELRRSANTFNNLPFLSKHVAVSAVEHHPELVIGSTGTDAEFDDPYLTNSLVVWVKGAIDEIKSEKKKQISSAYYYRADMSPGIAGSERYDGVMRDIIGNHVAHVEEGRAGADVMVNDEDPIARSWRVIQEAFEVEYV